MNRNKENDHPSKESLWAYLLPLGRKLQHLFFIFNILLHFLIIRAILYACSVLATIINYSL